MTPTTVTGLRRICLIDSPFDPASKDASCFGGSIPGCGDAVGDGLGVSGMRGCGLSPSIVTVSVGRCRAEEPLVLRDEREGLRVACGAGSGHGREN